MIVFFYEIVNLIKSIKHNNQFEVSCADLSSQIGVAPEK